MYKVDRYYHGPYNNPKDSSILKVRAKELASSINYMGGDSICDLDLPPTVIYLKHLLKDGVFIWELLQKSVPDSVEVVENEM